MESRKLIELYGRRFTPFAKIAVFIAILIIGVIIAFTQGHQHPVDVSNPSVEQGAGG